MSCHRKKYIQWKVDDFLTIFKRNSESVYRHVIFWIYENYQNITKLNKIFNGYSVVFKSEEIENNIVIIKLKTSFMEDWKEIFRFVKNDLKNFRNLLFLNELKFMYGCGHILPIDFFYNETLNVAPPYITNKDKRPGDHLNFDKFPEYLNGGFDYYLGNINDEICSIETFIDKKFNYDLYEGNLIDKTHDKIYKLQDFLVSYSSNYIHNTIDDNIYDIDRAVFNFLEHINNNYSENVYFYWRSYKIKYSKEKIYVSIGNYDEYPCYNFKVTFKNDKNIIQEVIFRKYDFKNPGLFFNYFNDEHFVDFNNISDVNFKNNILLFYFNSRKVQSIYNQYADNIYLIYIKIQTLIYNIVDNEYKIPEKYIDLILDFTEKIENIDDIQNKIFTYFKNFLNLILFLYNDLSYLVSKKLYDIIDSVVDYYNINQQLDGFFADIILSINNLNIFKYPENFNSINDKNFDKIIDNIDIEAINLIITYLYNSVQILKYSDSRHYLLYHIEKNIKNFKSKTAYRGVKESIFERSIIINTLLSKNFYKGNINKDLCVHWCWRMIYNYSDYILNSRDYDYNYNGKTIHVHVDGGRYDTNILFVINLFLNKIIKDPEKRNNFELNILIADRLTQGDIMVKKTDVLLSNLSFYLLNTDKLNDDIIASLNNLVGKIYNVDYPAICSKGAVKIEKIILYKLLPLIWSNNFEVNKIQDLISICDGLGEPDPGEKYFTRKKYNKIRDNFEKYIDSNSQGI